MKHCAASILRSVDNAFPPGKSGGLIEARLDGHPSAVRLSGFPPGKSGGLIEALLLILHAGVPG